MILNNKKTRETIQHHQHPQKNQRRIKKSGTQTQTKTALQIVHTLYELAKKDKKN